MRSAPSTRTRPASPQDDEAPRRRLAALLVDCLALAFVWTALVLPDTPDRLTPSALVQVPVEAVALAAMALTLPRRPTRVLVWLVGVLLGLLTALKVAGLVSVGVLGRPFDPVTDAAHLGPAVDFVSASFGSVAAGGAAVAAVLLVVLLLVGTPLSVGRAVRLVQRRRGTSVVAVLGLTAVWSVAAVSGLGIAPREPLAAADTVRFAEGEVRAVSSSLAEQRRFDAAVRVDPYRRAAPGDLSALRGKDVVLAFVESYGRVAVQGQASAGVQRVLDAGSRQLRASGYAARSAFLTSPTFGGVSWLAHSTLQSGVWVDNQSSYDRLLAGDRTSLTSAFGRAGWRTVALLPSDRGAWPQGRAHYRFDTVYDSSSLGYAGPGFGFSMMPDQYALQAFQRLELAPSKRPPLMAEVDLASSHGPWAPVPHMLAWDGLGDGSVFAGMHDGAQTAGELWSHRDRVPAAYMASIEYSLTALISFVERYGSDSLVLVLVGDHQPATIVSGHGGNHDVPITLVARDPEVISRISGWGWQDGLRPGAGAPVWRMDLFRDRFLGAFGKAPR
ncbi:CDP-alcohol phosphatidyltransferase [Pedococcus sp. KACC 23699]|uniref:CDP-alcohol phosphatidyltransferase n=1 Tax=Pedococcus sp. KACC 23699 TaxID=3149228 RepID=A0AAU7JS14_9MICO